MKSKGKIKYYLYTLLEPNTNNIKYVGFSYNPKHRYNQHMICKDVCHRTNWIKYLKEQGQKPILKIIDEVDTKEEALELEKKYINDLKLIGINLTNNTIGGEAPMAGKKHREETKRLMSEQRKGENNSFYGKKHSEEVMKRIIEKKKGKPSWNKGKKLSEEHRKNMCKPKSKPVYNKGKTRFDLQLMEKMLQQGIPQSDVAKYFKTDQGTISKYKRKHNFNILIN